MEELIPSTLRNIAKDFKFNEDTTFLGSGKLMLVICVAYLLGVIGIQKFMVKHEAFQLKKIAAYHNGFLSLSSLLLLILMIQQIYPKYLRKGLHGTVCDADMVTSYLEFYCYLNYLLKYYELSDTLLMVLKKKDIPFLHTYHHTMTLVLTHVELVGNVAVQWVPITLNLAVHVIMYYYYMLATFGYEVWWKKYLTSLQIIQFVIDIIACSYATFICFITNGGCHGDYFSAVVGLSIIGSYLFLFIDFFSTTYKKPKQPETDVGKTNQPKDTSIQKVITPTSKNTSKTNGQRKQNPTKNNKKKEE
jgi:hypothetical protein